MIDHLWWVWKEVNHMRKVWHTPREHQFIAIWNAYLTTTPQVTLLPDPFLIPISFSGDQVSFLLPLLRCDVGSTFLRYLWGSYALIHGKGCHLNQPLYQLRKCTDQINRMMAKVGQKSTQWFCWGCLLFDLREKTNLKLSKSHWRNVWIPMPHNFQITCDMGSTYLSISLQ